MDNVKNILHDLLSDVNDSLPNTIKKNDGPIIKKINEYIDLLPETPEYFVNHKKKKRVSETMSSFFPCCGIDDSFKKHKYRQL